MLRIVQYIALAQGIFLLLVLLKNKDRYQKPLYWLFLACLLSVVLFLIGDDENNLFFDDLDLFLFDSSLFVTFLFLFFKYKHSGQRRFAPIDLVFFIPNFLYLGIESFEVLTDSEPIWLDMAEVGVEFCLIAYLLYVIIGSLKQRSKDWVYYFVWPLVLLMTLNSIANIRELISGQELYILGYEDYNSYLLLILAFLFFFISFGLIDNPDLVLPKIKNGSYLRSQLRPEQIEDCRKRLVAVMEKEQLFMNQKLSISQVSDQIGLPRRYISEVLNMHMNISFHQFVNQYRISAFIKRLNEAKYNHYTLFGLATDVGFNSKSTFNAAFKKATGQTPLDFKNNLDSEKKKRPK